MKATRRVGPVPRAQVPAAFAPKRVPSAPASTPTVRRAKAQRLSASAREVNAAFGRRIRWYLDPSSSPASAAPRAAHDAGAATQAAQSAGSTTMGKRGAAVRKQWLCARGRGYRAPYGAAYGECHLFGSWQHLNNMLGPGPYGAAPHCPKVALAVLYHAPGPRTPQPRESTIFRHGCPGQATKMAHLWTVEIPGSHLCAWALRSTVRSRPWTTYTTLSAVSMRHCTKTASCCFLLASNGSCGP